MEPIALTIRKSTGKLISPPAIEAILGTLLQLEVTFVDDDDTAVELAADTTGRFVAKGALKHSGPAVLLDAAFTHTEGETTYLFAVLCDSESGNPAAPQLRELISGKDDLIITGQIEYTLPDEDEPRKSRPFDVTVINSPARSDDSAPDVAGEAASDWLDARAARIDKSLALTAGQRTQLLTNIGNTMQLRLSSNSDYLHLYTPAGVYKGSLTLIDLGQADL